MIGKEKLISELKKCIKGSKADGTSVCAISSTHKVCRFAYDSVHQDMMQESMRIFIKVITDDRIGVASTDTFSKKSLKECLRNAAEIARHSPSRKDIPALPKGNNITSDIQYDSKTANDSGKILISQLKHLFNICQGVGVKLAGSFASGENEVTVVNSQGSACYSTSTAACAKMVTMYRSLSGFASSLEHNIDNLNLELLLERSLKQCLHKNEPLRLPIGTYEVILEPEAVADLMEWMGYIAFGAKNFSEQTSFLAGRIGEQIMAKSVTIYDDGNDLEGIVLPFDFEGTPKQKVTFIDKGKALGVAYDTYYAKLYGKSSSGHANTPDDYEGPHPSNLFMSPGKKTLSDMVSSCRRGILIPRFHYVNGLLNPREALMTGLTREGAFLVENGRVSRPIKTMRFTQGMLEAFSHIKGISRERKVIADLEQEFGCAIAPAIHLEKFRFTGHSEG